MITFSLSPVTGIGRHDGLWTLLLKSACGDIQNREDFWGGDIYPAGGGGGGEGTSASIRVVPFSTADVVCLNSQRLETNM